uniref:T9SS type B sorting domain-containing protein n=1 Tax=Algibacter sp. AS12 TaxID=3135773 RepID=UPI00398AD4F7
MPKYFTLNNDGNNDTFDLGGLEYFGSSQVSIFNRYGKLLKHAVNKAFSWMVPLMVLNYLPTTIGMLLLLLIIRYLLGMSH